MLSLLRATRMKTRIESHINARCGALAYLFWVGWSSASYALWRSGGVYPEREHLMQRMAFEQIYMVSTVRNYSKPILAPH
jgi:hypothetical protein